MLAASTPGALDQRLSLDVQGVDALRRTVRNSPEEGLRQVSRQFEAVFMQMVLKSMREAVPSEGLFGGESEKLYTSMLDQQLSQSLSGRGLGLAEAMYSQLSRVAGAASEAPPAPAAPASAPAPEPVPTSQVRAYQQCEPTASREPVPTHVEQFVSRMLPAAEAASRASGVPAPLILAQAALESGWGQREIRGADGSPSFNVFGIKADRGWRGRVVDTATTEYVGGAAQSTRAAFRAYGSYEEAFADYAKFLASNPRYAPVLASANAEQAAHGLQRAGYATDPDYGAKLVRIMRKLA